MLVPLVVLSLVCLNRGETGTQLTLCHTLSSSYNTLRTHQNQQDRKSQVSLASTVLAGKLFLLLIHPQALFGQDVWTHKDTNEDLFLFKASQPTSYSYSLANIYNRLPAFLPKTSDNQLASLATKHLDLLVVFQQHTLQDRQLDLMSLIYIYMFYQ